MYKIWFERAMSPHFAPLLEDIAVPLRPASATPDDLFSALTEVDGIIASILVYDAAVMDRGPRSQFR